MEREARQRKDSGATKGKIRHIDAYLYIPRLAVKENCYGPSTKTTKTRNIPSEPLGHGPRFRHGPREW